MTALLANMPPTDAATTVTMDGNLGTAGVIGQTITIGSERMLVHRGLGTSGFIVERGVGGTTIAAHVVGATVTLDSATAIGYPILGAGTAAPGFYAGTVDPSAGTVGVAAQVGSIYLYNNAGTAGQEFVKVGAAGTAWTATI